MRDAMDAVGRDCLNARACDVEPAPGCKCQGPDWTMETPGFDPGATPQLCHHRGNWRCHDTRGNSQKRKSGSATSENPHQKSCQISVNPIDQLPVRTVYRIVVLGAPVPLFTRPRASRVILPPTMAFRLPATQLCRVATNPGAITIRPLLSSLRQPLQQSRWLATPTYPVTQSRIGSQGPTAMVFLNMGGPSTVDEVGDFLSRLFVSTPFPPSIFFSPALNMS